MLPFPRSPGSRPGVLPVYDELLPSWLFRPVNLQSRQRRIERNSLRGPSPGPGRQLLAVLGVPGLADKRIGTAVVQLRPQNRHAWDGILPKSAELGGSLWHPLWYNGLGNAVILVTDVTGKPSVKWASQRERGLDWHRHRDGSLHLHVAFSMSSRQCLNPVIVGSLSRGEN